MVLHCTALHCTALHCTARRAVLCGVLRCVVVTGVDIAECLGHLVQQRVHEAKRWFASSEAFVIDEGEDTSCGGAGAGGASHTHQIRTIRPDRCDMHTQTRHTHMSQNSTAQSNAGNMTIRHSASEPIEYAGAIWLGCSAQLAGWVAWLLVVGWALPHQS
eukprot:COSAG06_NODE_17134_length_959_cov_1.627907_1_plen_160_part_00